MECNKDEAVRAKQIAEKKMENNDFDGALKIALKAQNLFPELENITQLLSICNVHCSAQKKILGSEKDWYGILQVEKLADESIIRKQYRRLALILHPDKNRFPGAEAAFKLICEANAILSDPTKKTLHDSKIRVTVVRSAPVNPPPHMKQNYQFNKQDGDPKNVSNGFNCPNQHQAAQPSFSIRQEMFWTSCAFCSMKYQYPKNLMKTLLKCQQCSKFFTGHDISAKGGVSATANDVPVKPDISQPSGFQGMSVGSSVSREASEWSASRKMVRPEPGVKSTRVESVCKVTKVGVRAKGKGVDICDDNPLHGKKEVNGDAENREKGNLKNKRMKKGRKHVVLSSESSDTDTSSDSDIEDVVIKKDFNSGPSHVQFVRRSSRKRQNVTYNEGVGYDDDDNDGGGGGGGGEDPKQENQNGTVHQEEIKDVDFDKIVKGSVKADCISGDHSDAIIIESDSDQDSNIRENPEKDICNCEDPEFNDFDKDRDENCFSVNQVWACYDSADGMPRFYAKVKKVSASPFELNITWLEANPTDEAHFKWIKADLPVGCGTFKLGETKKESSRLTFSHQIHCEKNRKRNSFTMYPRKGQVWALFKDWDLNWSLSPEGHREFKYEVVEILSGFHAVKGAKVCYLDKVGGFVSLFRRSSTAFFLLGPNELYKFSHSIPCCKMTGSEREGVPVGSFELDPASLPQNPDALYYPGKTKMHPGTS